MKQPERLPLDKIYSILPREVRQNRKLIAFREGMGVATGINNSLFNFLELTSSPYLLEDYRMGLILKGRLRGIINLREHTMKEGTLVFVTPGTIVEPLEVSEDFLMEGMGLPADKFLLSHGGRLPELFNGQTMDGRQLISAESRALLDRMFHLLHDLLEREDTDCEVIYGMVTVITRYYNRLFHDRPLAATPSHSGETFNRFLRLVNLHGSREHRLAFYASQLCITSRYLGTLVQDTSGVGAKEWIDRAVTTKAKVLLRHSNKQTSEIADELCFPSSSFFCKYFKRRTGLTPGEYRDEK